MDLLLGNFVKKHIDKLNDNELKDLEVFLSIKDEIIHKWYFENVLIENIPSTKILKMFKNFRL